MMELSFSSDNEPPCSPSRGKPSIATAVVEWTRLGCLVINPASLFGVTRPSAPIYNRKFDWDGLETIVATDKILNDDATPISLAF